VKESHRMDLLSTEPLDSHRAPSWVERDDCTLFERNFVPSIYRTACIPSESYLSPPIHFAPRIDSRYCLRPHRANVLSRLLILVVGLPLMLLDIIADAMAAQTDMELTGSFDTCDALLSVAAKPKADVLILSAAPGGLREACRDLLYVYPRARFLGITADGRGAFMYGLRPHRVAIGELTLDGLLAAIRGEMQVGSGVGEELRSIPEQEKSTQM